MNTTVQMESTDQQSYLTFRLGDELFAAHVGQVSEILELPRITHVPRSPEYMRGVINLRGQVLPVIDTRIKFGMTQTQDTVSTCIVVLTVDMDGQPFTFGALVDGVQEVMAIVPDQIQDPPSLGGRYKAGFVSGMVKENDQFIMILRLGEVFTMEEQSILHSAIESTSN